MGKYKYMNFPHDLSIIVTKTYLVFLTTFKFKYFSSKGELSIQIQFNGHRIYLPCIHSRPTPVNQYDIITRPYSNGTITGSLFVTATVENMYPKWKCCVLEENKFSFHIVVVFPVERYFKYKHTQIYF